MNTLCVDTETTTFNNGGPFDKRNKLVCFSWADSNSSGAAQANADSLAELAERINGCRTLVGFNIKFDLHWLRNVGIRVPDECRVYDCQTGEFLLSNQKERYPSLEDALVRRDLGHKVDVVKEEYWNKGINTDEIPWSILEEYARVDAEKTLELYHKQVEIMSPETKRLWMLMGMDLLVLEEIEYNGIKFDEELCKSRAETIKQEIQGITNQLSSIYPNVAINFNSGDQLSAFLYGGTIVEEGKEHIGFFKTGIKAGQPKYKNVEIKHELPRLVSPIRGSELSKPGLYSTNADTLLKLRGSKKTKSILELIQRQVRLHTLLSKSYEGILKSNREGNWEPGMLHGQFNQVTAQTGRLSSSNPNQQNFDSEVGDLFITRFNDC